MEKEGGSFVGGGDSGRKPLGMETVKGAWLAKSLSLVGMVVSRGKAGGAAREPIGILNLITGFDLGLCCQENIFS